jgi:hypothetical protein
MKTVSILFSMVLLFSSAQLPAQKPHFFVECSQAMGDTSQKYAPAFARLVADELKLAFPCVNVNTQSDIVNKLDKLRFQYLMGDIEGDLPSFCDQLAHDYWVHLRLIDYDEGKTMIVARCFKYKKVDCIADAGNIRCANNLPAITEGCRQITKKLIDLLSKFEVCPFTGPVNLTIKSQFDTTSTNQYEVFCNETDQTYRREESIYNSTQSDWQLQRKGIPWASGTMTFKMSETSDLVVENGCYRCPSGRMGGRVYSMKKSFVVEGSGISTESSYKGNKQDDLRIELEFFEDGTYILTARGTSKPAQGDEKEDEKAEGTCDNIPSAPRTYPREVTIPLKVILGPFPGKATDKILTHKDVIKRRNPSTNEMETISYDFTLNLKEN